MAKVRILKKNINNLINQLLVECYVYKIYNKEADDKKIQGVINDLISKQNELISKVNNFKEKDSKRIKEFYKGVKVELIDTIKYLDKLV